MTKTIDLNADLGEGDAYDEALLRVVSSCNIACGGHAGDTGTMARTLAAAVANGVTIGAHPGYPDREGRGRRARFMHGAALRDSLVAQLEALAAVAADADVAIAHVKPHGALYNDSADDPELAATLVEALRALPGPPALVGLPASAHADAARDAGLEFVAEAFVDRAYLPSGRLVPRAEPGAVHGDTDVVTAQAVSLATRGRVQTPGGQTIAIAADTLCLHGDTPGADRLAAAVRAALEACGVKIRAPRP
ncbi:MAG: 5-oxoprolinase subunit PxpA [Woeseiaceae bacterium]|nr:5-oxoprolinase subunit PxpA [Woeseiaceae bacterium]